MNYSVKKSGNGKTFIILGFLVLIGIATFLAVWLTRKPTNTRSKAAASTSLSFSPNSLAVGVGQMAMADVTLDPGSNQVSALNLVITFDGSKFDTHTATISPSFADLSSTNAQGFVQILKPFALSCTGTACTMSMTLSIGGTPTLAIIQPQKVASVSLMATSPTDSSGTTVAVDSQSQVFSIGPTDQPAENVLLLSSLTPLIVTIGGQNTTPTPPVCSPNQSTCSWDAVQGATTYHVIVTNVGTGNIVQQGDVPAPGTSMQFSSQAGQTYNCAVTVTNACGATSNPGQATKTCPISPTPTPPTCQTPGTVQNLRLICPNGANCNNQ